MKTLLTLACLTQSAVVIPAQPPPPTGSEKNLKALARAVKIYRAANNGKNPPNVAELYYQGYIDTLSVFVHPSSGALLKRTELAEKTDYTLDPLPGTDGVTVREKKSFQNDGSVLAALSDGTVRSVPLSATTSPSPPPSALVETPQVPAKAESGSVWWIVGAVVIGLALVAKLLKARRRQ